MEHTKKPELKRHKWADVIIRAANGEPVQRLNDCGQWVGVERPFLTLAWNDDTEYRIKPNIVKKWLWVFYNIHGNTCVSDGFYTDDEAKQKFGQLDWYVKLEPTEIEEEE